MNGRPGSVAVPSSGLIATVRPEAEFVVGSRFPAWRRRLQAGRFSQAGLLKINFLGRSKSWSENR
jgi:hypothetical protein